jgi:hypothetical protein
MDMTLIRLTPPGDVVRSSQNPNPNPNPIPNPNPNPIPITIPNQNSNQNPHPNPNQNPHPVRLSPEIVADILWAVALPADGLEHVRARHGPGGQIDLAIFHRTDLVAQNPEDCLALCRRAIATAPALTGWTAQRLRTAHPYAAG